MAAVLTRITHPRPRLTIVPPCESPQMVPLAPRIVAQPAPVPVRRVSRPVELPRVSRPQATARPMRPAAKAERRAFAWIVLVMGYCALRLVF